MSTADKRRFFSAGLFKSAWEFFGLAGSLVGLLLVIVTVGIGCLLWWLLSRGLVVAGLLYALALVGASPSLGPRENGVFGPQQSRVTIPGTVERHVEDLAAQTVGFWPLLVVRSPALISIEASAVATNGPTTEPRRLVIKYRARKGPTLALSRAIVLLGAKRLFQWLWFSKDPQGWVGILELRPHFSLMDKYGHEHEEAVAELVLPREAAARIDWDKIDNERFARILQEEGGFWLHPAVR